MPVIHHKSMQEGFDIKDINVVEISIMIKILKGDRNLASIARDMDISIQVVRYYVGSMRKKGLINDLSVTPTGFEFLTKSLETLRGFIRDSSDILYSINDWEIICDQDFRKDDTVYLYMKDGYLHGTHEQVSSASGTVKNEALSGQRTLINQIKGIIDVKFGTIIFLIMKNMKFEDKKRYLHSLDELCSGKNGSSKKLFLLGEGAFAMFGDKENTEKFAPLQSAFESATRGLDSVVICSEEAFNLNFETFFSLKEKYSNVQTELNFI